MDPYLNQLDNHQDWKTIIIKNPKQNVKNSKKKVNNTNIKKISIENKADNDELKHKQLSTDLRISIQKARCSKNLTQKELAQKINVSHQIISDIESGKAIYNEQHINKLKRFLQLHK